MFCEMCTQRNEYDSSETPETPKETTESLKKEIEEYKEEIDKLEQDRKYLRKEIQNFKSPAAMMQGDNDQTRFYTGLPSFAVFASLSNLFSGLISPGLTGCGLSYSDQLLLVEVEIGYSKSRYSISI